MTRRRIAAAVTSDELRELESVCAWLGLTKAEYVRMCVFGETVYHRKKMMKAGRSEEYVYHRGRAHHGNS